MEDKIVGDDKYWNLNATRWKYIIHQGTPRFSNRVVCTFVIEYRE